MSKNKLVVNVNATENEYKINENLVDNNEFNEVKHYLDFKFPPVPYLWHYNDFSQPYPIYGVLKISKSQLIILINSFGNINETYVENYNDANSDFYVTIQYKKERYWYAEETSDNEIYISYHTWLHINDMRQYEINNYAAYSMKYSFLSAIYPLIGDLTFSKKYPYKNEKKKIPGGMAIGSKPTINRAVIHKHNGVIKFSGQYMNDFRTSDDNTQDNIILLSVMKDPCLITFGQNRRISVNKVTTPDPDRKTNCLTLHVFRNKYDNNPNDENFQIIVNKIINSLSPSRPSSS